MIKTKNILTLFFVSILVFVFMTFPSFENFLENKRVLDHKKEELHIQDQYFNKLKDIDSNLDFYSLNLELVDLAISDDSVAPSLIYYIENLSQDNGLFFQSVNSVSEIPSSRFNELKKTELSFSLVGDYSDFKNFVDSMEKSIKIIETDNVFIFFDMEEYEEDTERKTLSYDVTIKTYYY